MYITIVYHISYIYGKYDDDGTVLISSIASEVNKTVFFFTKHILNLKYTKQ